MSEDAKDEATPPVKPPPVKKNRKPMRDDDDDGPGQEQPQLKQKMLPTGLSRAIVIAAFLWGTVMLATGLFSNRYELLPAPSQENSFMYRLDRLTGAVHFCGSQQCVRVPIKPAPGD